MLDGGGEQPTPTLHRRAVRRSCARRLARRRRRPPSTDAVAALLAELDGEHGYLAVQAYLDRLRDAPLAERPGVPRRARTGRPVTFGWGPRFLHSTGQYHKGGPRDRRLPAGDRAARGDLAVPGRAFTFGTSSSPPRPPATRRSWPATAGRCCASTSDGPGRPGRAGARLLGSTEPRVEVQPDADALATARRRRAAVAARRPCRPPAQVPQSCSPAATIAASVHRALARLSADSEVDWTRVVFWLGDERFVAGDSPDRNAGQARARPARRRRRPPSCTRCPPPTPSPTPRPPPAAYADALREHGAGSFDVLMLGLGPDGHVASLFPGHPALAVDDRIAVAVHDSPKPPPERVP